MSNTVFWVALGGALGALARYGLAKGLEQWNPHTYFSAGILAANLLGCFLMGFLVLSLGQMNPSYRDLLAAFLLTGVLGSLTTFSTFILEVFKLAQSGDTKQMLAHFAAHMVLGILGLWVGYGAAAKIWPPAT